jgi:hydroxyacylglutathione hydrolase
MMVAAGVGQFALLIIRTLITVIKRTRYCGNWVSVQQLHISLYRPILVNNSIGGSFMNIRALEAGPFQTMGYIASDSEGNAVIIDVPLDSREAMLGMIRNDSLSVAIILLTHGHFDHVGEVRSLAEELDVPVLIHESDASLLERPMAMFAALDVAVEGMQAHRYLTDDEILQCGSLNLRVIHVPGHTPGHIALYEQSEGVLFSGDVLFHSSIGRTDLPGGDYDTLMRSITERLLTLPDETLVYPGHGPHTTIGFERAHNPFILDYLDHF